MELLPLTHQDLRNEIACLQKELSNDVRVALVDSQAAQLAAMRDVWRKEFGGHHAKSHISWEEESHVASAIPLRSLGGAIPQPTITTTITAPVSLSRETSNESTSPSRWQESSSRRSGMPLRDPSFRDPSLCPTSPSGHLGAITHIKSAVAVAESRDYFDHKRHHKRLSIGKEEAKIRRNSRKMSVRGEVAPANRRGSIGALWPVSHGLGGDLPGVPENSNPVLKNTWAGDEVQEISAAKRTSARPDLPAKPTVMTARTSESMEVIEISHHGLEGDLITGASSKSEMSSYRLDPESPTSPNKNMRSKMPRGTIATALPMSPNYQRQDTSTFPITLHERVLELVLSTVFEFSISFVVFSNAIYIGLQTDLTARSKGNPSATFVLTDRIVDTCFCIVFATEILLRVYAHRRRFLTNPDWSWNVFDCTVVFVQSLELTISWSVAGNLPPNFSMLRILRVLRVIRMVRLVKIMRPLRILVMSIIGSLQPLFWTVMLLFFVIYLMGVFLTQTVADHKNSDEVEPKQRQALEKYFGTLAISLFSLFQSVSGGVDWEDMVNPLIENISGAMGIFFAFYIAFCLLALMNVVSGYFVQAALENTKRENETYMVTLVRKVLSKLDVDQDGEITWLEFYKSLDHPEMKEYFKTVDVDISDAQSLWNLLDVDQIGSISAEDLLNGCVRLQGPASALGQNLVMRELGQQRCENARLVELSEKCLADMCQMLVSHDTSENDSGLQKAWAERGEANNNFDPPDPSMNLGRPKTISPRSPCPRGAKMNPFAWVPLSEYVEEVEEV